MPWVAAGLVASSAISYMSSRSQASGARDAANAQSASAERALQFQKDQYAQGREDLAPWRQFGEQGLQDLAGAQQKYAGAVNDPSSYEKSPGYGWLQQQGIDALNKGASASGALDSGARSKDLMAYGQGLAKQDYTGYLGRLESLMNRYAGNAGIGQTASGSLATLGQQSAQNMGNIAMNQGNAQASGIINQTNAQTGLYQNLANLGTNAANQYALNNSLLHQGGGGGGSGYPAEYGYGGGR